MYIAFTKRCFGFIPFKEGGVKRSGFEMKGRREIFPHVGFNDTWYLNLQQLNDLAAHGCLLKVRGSEGFFAAESVKVKVKSP
jgi:hypothetical protein